MKPALDERLDEQLRVLLAARLERQLGLGLEDADAAPLAVVRDREHVRALGRDHADDVRELARPVGDHDADDEVAARRGEAEARHRHQRRRVDVAAREHGADGSVARDEAAEQGRDGRGAGALDDELRALEQEDDRLRDGLVLDDDHLVEEVAEDRRA